MTTDIVIDALTMACVTACVTLKGAMASYGNDEQRRQTEKYAV